MKRVAAAFVLLLTILPIGSAQAAGTIHVCGVVTEYFVSDIASGGRITIAGTSYRIASSASFQRTRPLPDITVGSNVCIDGTTNDAGDLLDFTASFNSPSSTPSNRPLPSTASSPQNDAPPIALYGLVGLAALAVALILARRIARRGL